MTPMRMTDSPQPGPNRATGGEVSPERSTQAGLERLLAQWIGLDTTTLGTASLTRACQRRLEASGLGSMQALQAAVETNPRERDLLVEEVVVSESWFFRDEQTFSFLESFVRGIAAIPGRRPVRILSVPCACGEEPYSIAMRLFDAGMTAESFSIDAFDVSHACLERARAGRYSANAFRNADQRFRRHWFRDEGSTSVIAPQIRSQVRFAWGNLLDEGFGRDQPPYDIVFCRNLLIYLTADARQRAEATLTRLLAADGGLVLGAAEPPIMRGRWRPAGTSSMFALCRSAGSGDLGLSTGSGSPKRPSPAPTRGPTPPTRPPPRMPAATAGRPPASSPGSHAERVVRAPVSTGLATLLVEVGELANAARHMDAIAACEAHARDVGPSAELFFMLGTLYQAHGDLDRAEGCFHKTLYLDPLHEEAALALALLAGCRGDERMAESYRETATRIYTRKTSA